MKCLFRIILGLIFLSIVGFEIFTRYYVAGEERKDCHTKIGYKGKDYCDCIYNKMVENRYNIAISLINNDSGINEVKKDFRQCTALLPKEYRLLTDLFGAFD